jgi:valyl-tRNA synthetase
MISSPAGNDLLWDESSNEQGLFFNNKIWNALKLVKMWESKTGEDPQSPGAAFATRWFAHRLREARQTLDEQYRDFRLSEALKTIYSLIWDDFCSYYLEWVKPAFGENIDRESYERTLDFFEELMQLLHPFMPFITEEVYHLLRQREDDLVVRPLGKTETADPDLLKSGALLKEVISSIRDARNKQQLKPRDSVRLHIQTDEPQAYRAFESIVKKQANAESVSYNAGQVPNSITVVVQKDKIFIESTAPVDAGAQKSQLQKDLDYLKGFLLSVEKKLGNERFVQNARPEVIDGERKKKADAEEKIRVIEESLKSL